MAVGDSAKRFNRTLGWCAGAALTTGALIVPYPFAGDQSLFAVFARMMSEGSTLYRDIWDVKQPGIFWFFELAGFWNGFSPLAIHLVEVIVWVAASVLIALELRTRLARSWLAGLVPILAAGLFFAVARVGDLTQVEPFVSVLTGGVVVLLIPGSGRQGPRWFTAGVLAGVIGALKLIALVVPALVVVAALWRARTERAESSSLLGLFSPFAAGFLIPAAAVAVWVAANDLWSVVWFTWFEYPPQVLEVQSRPLERLLNSALRFAVVSPLVVLAIFAFGGPRRKQGRQIASLAAAAVAGGVILVLGQLWWSYSFFVLLVPLAILAVIGADRLADWPRRTRNLILGILALLAIPAVSNVGQNAVAAGSLVFGGSLVEYQEEFAGHARASDAVELVDLEQGSEVYVLGSPAILEISRSDQSIPINGWSPEFWTSALWEEVAADLGDGPTEALFVADWALRLSQERAPWFESAIEESYDLDVAGAGGSWWLPDEGD